MLTVEPKSDCAFIQSAQCLWLSRSQRITDYCRLCQWTINDFAAIGIYLRLWFVWRIYRNQSTITSPDSLSKIRKYSRTNSPSLGCCVLCQSDWADYFTVNLLIDQHVGVLKIKSLFCFLLISRKQVNLSTPLRSEPTWSQSTITSPDSLSEIRKYSRTNNPSLGCCVLCQNDWADYFTVILLIDQHVGVLKIKSLFCFLLISGKQVNLSTLLRSEPTWAVTGMNWQVFTLTDDSRKRSWSWSCVKWINLKVRNDDISRRKYASIAKLSAIVSQEVFVWKVMEK